MPADRLAVAAKAIVSAFTRRGLAITIAESCTGGMIATAITDIPGASKIFERGFVTYSNAAKTEMLGVSAALIKKHGAVSEETAKAMAEGALKRSRADVAVATTGIAGPGGGTREKPVGLVYIALATRKETAMEQFRFKGGRGAVRRAAALAALEMLRGS